MACVVFVVVPLLHLVSAFLSGPIIIIPISMRSGPGPRVGRLGVTRGLAFPEWRTVGGRGR